MSFRFSVVERLPEAASAAAAKGTLVHRALQLLFSEREAGRRDRVEAEAALLRAWEEARRAPEVRHLELGEEGEAAFLRDASLLLDRYFELEDPDAVTPIGLELELKVDFDGVTLRGIIDRLDRMPDGSLAVVDYKTGRAPHLGNTRSRLSSVQLYAFLCERLLGERPRVVRLMYLRERLVISAAATDQSLRGVQLRARAVWEAIARACERSDFRPNPSALCKRCSFQEYCPAFGGDPEAAAPALALGLRRVTGRPAATLPA